MVGVLAPGADGREVGQDRTASAEGLAGSEDVLAERAAECLLDEVEATELEVARATLFCAWAPEWRWCGGLDST